MILPVHLLGTDPGNGGIGGLVGPNGATCVWVCTQVISVCTQIQNVGSSIIPDSTLSFLRAAPIVPLFRSIFEASSWMPPLSSTMVSPCAPASILMPSLFIVITFWLLSV